MIIKTVTAKTAADLLNGDMELSPAESAMVLQYKDLIREQDKRLHDLQLTVDSLRHENHMLAAQNEELNNSLAQLRDQNMVLRAQVQTRCAPGTVLHLNVHIFIRFSPLTLQSQT